MRKCLVCKHQFEYEYIDQLICPECEELGVFRCKECFDWFYNEDMSIINNVCPECLEFQVNDINESLSNYSATLENVTYDVRRVIEALKNRDKK
jgi:hypothetical protein